MSSAILYLAIIAIWACVLIPRWLKRDSARSAAVAEHATGTGQASEFADADTTEADPEDGTPDAPAAQSPRGDARRRVLAARRRLLWMMLGLEAAGAALAATGLAAWWVIAPPTVMLAGYLLLLREAAQADADASRREREAIEAAQTRARERAERTRLRDQQAAAARAIPVAFAAAPVPEDYEDLGHGRDFTPAAGPGYRRYSGPDDSYADDDGAYDQYTENRLRAVGD
jgi:hypothetical protein